MIIKPNDRKHYQIQVLLCMNVYIKKLLERAIEFISKSMSLPRLQMTNTIASVSSGRGTKVNDILPCNYYYSSTTLMYIQQSTV